MKYTLKSLAIPMAAVILSACAATPSVTQPVIVSTNTPSVTQQANEAAVRAVMQRYQQAMRTADVDGIASVLHPDVVTTFQDRLTAKGKAQVLQNYQGTFAAMDFGTIDYVIDDIVVDDQLAMVATIHPVGSYVTNKKDGSRHLDHNRELFILKQSQGDWLIYRYMYNQTPEQAR
ncbi:nuclear transport factor 2 family protein [Moraxella sp. RCAD0137]|uniref:nuclear transport factor 2 family protein n=1 Tax=Moraxella sp. RCAD0137 TaxID=1775913 RepID=UPI000C9FDAFF|nr:nuclear transport factor 2 family protein [Moraxella sp. RCAD0137]PNP97170.1 hypothetical protein AZ602_08160 [Moraxella sp. RCAD0137]